MSTKYIVDGIFDEPFYDDEPYELKTGFKVKKVLFDGKSKYQEILIIDTVNHGRILAIDGNIQLTTSDEFAYHEMLAFTPLSCHQDPKKVFIVGGGDGGLLAQVLKFPSVESVVLCDIDEMVVQKCKQHIPELAKALDNPKCNVIIKDAFDYLRKCQAGSFDVIICDCTDPENSAVSDRLFGEQFYGYVHRALSDKGIACAQTSTNYWQSHDVARDLINAAKSHFPVVSIGFVNVASFSCGQNGFLVCSKNTNQDLSKPLWSFDEETLDHFELRYYDTNLHKCIFTLPRFVRKALTDDTYSNGKESTLENGELPVKY